MGHRRTKGDPQAGLSVLKTLTTAVPEIFNECQTTATQHRRNAVALRKLQEQCSALRPEEIALYLHQNPDQTPLLVCSSSEYPGESIFNNEFVRNLNKVLPVKKREPSVELVLRFVASFVQYAHERDAKPPAPSQAPTTAAGDDIFGSPSRPTDHAMGDPAEADADTLSSRFIEFLMYHLLKGFGAKDKPVRLRVVQLVAQCVNSFGEIDEDLYVELRTRLYERIHDKESAIRVQAVMALCRLQNGEDEDEVVMGTTAEGGLNVTKTLLNILRYDPSAEVRRSVLLNIAKTPATLPRVLERSRDFDTTNRRLTYLRALREIGDFRILSIDAREKLLSHGIKDREATVKQACVRMLSENWLEYANNNLIELLERLDVVNSTIAEPALKELFKAHPDIPGTFEFTDEIWENLTPETAFLIRVTLVFFQEVGQDERLDAAQPEVLKLAQYIEKFTGLLDVAEDDEAEANYLFIVHQLLLVASLCDFADELGRRRFMTLLRDMLLLPTIPETHIETIIDIIFRLAISERDFTRLIVEAISDIRSSVEDAEDEATSAPDEDERQLELLLMKVKCLIITKLLLERCQERLRDNNTVFGLLNEYIIPAVQDTEALVQELGIVCLAHCCYLDKSLAEENITAFIQAIRRGEGDIREKALMALADLALMYDMTSLSQRLESEQTIEKVLGECLESPELPIQATAAEAVVRLLYCRKLTRPVQILETLLILYFHPITLDNHRYRQCLTYFMQVYSYSAHENQQVLQQAVVPTLCQLIKVHRSVGDGNTMLTPLQAAQQLADWTDPRIAVAAYQRVNRLVADIDQGLHATIAIDALKSGFSASSGTRKVLTQFVNRLHVDEAAGEVRLKELTALILAFKQTGIVGDTVTRNALTRFEATVHRALVALEVLAPDTVWDENDLRELPELETIYGFINKVYQELSLLKPAPQKPMPPTTPGPFKTAVDPNATTLAKPRMGQPLKVVVKVEELQNEIDSMLLGSDEELSPL
ncbi:chromosome condensation complex Condensin, subunit G [Dimargaris xerosporica]|nr:chromosome condensation complex Condensin, subunit G [Dimargaris xerosporica]